MRLLFLAALEEHRMFSPRASASRVTCSQEWTLLRTCSRSASVRTPHLTSKCRPCMLSDTGFVRGAIPGGIEKKVACQLWCGHQFLCSCLVQHIEGHNSRAHEVKKSFTRTTWTNVCTVSHQERPFANKVMEPQRRACTDTREGSPPGHRAGTSNKLCDSAFQK